MTRVWQPKYFEVACHFPEIVLVCLFNLIASCGGLSGQVFHMLPARTFRVVDMMCQDWLIQLWRKNAGTDGCSLGVTKTSGFTCQASKQGNALRTSFTPSQTPGHGPP